MFVALGVFVVLCVYLILHMWISGVVSLCLYVCVYVRVPVVFECEGQVAPPAVFLGLGMCVCGGGHPQEPAPSSMRPKLPAEMVGCANADVWPLLSPKLSAGGKREEGGGRWEEGGGRRRAEAGRGSKGKGSVEFLIKTETRGRPPSPQRNRREGDGCFRL